MSPPAVEEQGQERMVRTEAADELCEYCEVSLEFFSNTARWEEKPE